jgi:hypothetical protein
MFFSLGQRALARSAHLATCISRYSNWCMICQNLDRVCSFGWWLMLVCSERKVLLAGGWWAKRGEIWILDHLILILKSGFGTICLISNEKRNHIQYSNHLWYSHDPTNDWCTAVQHQSLTHGAAPNYFFFRTSSQLLTQPECRTTPDVKPEYSFFIKTS